MRNGATQSLLGFRVPSYDASRLFIMLAVLLLHFALVSFLAARFNAPHVVHVDEFASEPIYVLPPAQLEKVLPPEPAVAVRKPAVSNRPRETTAITIQEAKPEPLPPSPIAERAPDWSSEAKEVAQQTARSMVGSATDPVKPPDELPIEKPPLGIFERGPAHRAGDIEIIGPGIERRWVSSRCYQEFGRPQNPFATTGPRVNPVRCMVGRSKPDGDLFDHLKPQNLEREP